MTKTSTLSLKNILSSNDYHSKVTGDTKVLDITLSKKGLNKVRSTPKQYFQIMKVWDLEPLESQRNTKTSWIAKALSAGKGYDPIAAGIIQVAKDISTGKHYIWDGCGRHALAQAVGIEELNCWITEISEKEAAHYFVYTQKTSNRNLKPAELFINGFEHGDEKCLATAALLQRLSVRIQGADDYWVPRVPASEIKNYPQVKERSVYQAMKYAGNDESIVRFARDTIIQAGWNDDEIRQDLLPGLVIFYMCYPEAMKNGLNKAIRTYFQALAGVSSQAKLSFKQAGGNMHNREAESVALGIVRLFRSTPNLTAQHRNIVTEIKMKEYISILMNKSVEEFDFDL